MLDRDSFFHSMFSSLPDDEDDFDLSEYQGNVPFDEEGFPLMDALDRDILMHRDAHFSGSFQAMIEYYEEEEGRGIFPDFEVSRMQELAGMERAMGQDLAALVLSSQEAQTVARAKKCYQSLRDIYEVDSPKSELPKAIADLILTEEEEPVDEIAAVVAFGSPAVPLLIKILEVEDFIQPTFPGYGRAPCLALACLGKLKSQAALPHLFQAVQSEDVEAEEVAIQALVEIGEPAKAFLLQHLDGKPINADNLRAAAAIVAFPNDEQIAQGCLKALRELDCHRHLQFAQYLVLGCEGLKNHQEQEELSSWLQKPTVPEPLKEEISVIVRSFQRR